MQSTLRLRPEISQLVILVDFLEEFCVRHDIPTADAHALTVSAEELFANTLNHSATPATEIEFALAANSEAITATYSDDGSPYDPTSRPAVDTTLSLDRRRLGGLGIHYIRKTMRRFDYEWRDGRNVITIERAITRPDR
jgi:anti-sigma regulatory factor (Ser/Thr protein kinase)